MATVICPSFSGAAVLRATKLDGCCKPVFEDPDNPGNSGQVTTDAFVSIAVTPGGEGGEATGGEQQPIAKADGQVCFNTISCPTPQTYSLNFELCALDPALILIMKPTWCPVREPSGLIVGFTAVAESGCEPSAFALEVWMNVYQGAGAACSRSRGGAAYGYLLFPCINGVQIGSWTIQNGPITFSFTGTTRRSGAWGKGPYNVMWDSTRPMPLPCPVRPNADFVQFVTTFPPPEAGCGMEPVESGIPEPAQVFIERGSNAMGCLVDVRADNFGYGPVMIDWGDGAITETPDGVMASHSYNSICGDPEAPPRTVSIKVCDKTFPQVCTTRTITVPLPRDEPVITCIQDSEDDTGKTVLVDVQLPPQAWCGPPDEETVTCACPGESPIGSYGLRIDWGEDVAPDDRLQYVAVESDCRATLRHTYTTDGRFPIKVCRNDITRWCARCEYVAGGLRPEVTFISFDESCNATISVDNNNRGPVSVDWGDGQTTTSIQPGEISHPYTAAIGQSFLVTVCSEAETGGCRTIRTPVCTGGGSDLVNIVATCDPTDPSGFTILVTADNRGHGSVTIHAPDSSSIDDDINSGDGVEITHVVYPSSATGPHTITATDPDEAERTGTANVVLPCEPGPSLTAVCGANHYTVTLVPEPGSTPKYPLTIDWGDGAVITYTAGQPLQHTYYRQGDPLQPERAATQQLGGPITLSQTTVHQQADRDTTNGDVYATQIIQGGRQLAGESAPVSHADRAAAGDMAISRVSAAGTLVGSMYCRKFDHGSGIGMERSGSGIYLWTAYDPVASGANAYGRQVARFQFSNGAVLDPGDAGIEVFDPKPGSDHVNPCLDLEHDQIGVRYRTPGDNQYHIAVWSIADFKARNFANPIYDTPVTEQTNFQCWCVYGRYAYHFYGAAYGDDNPKPGNAVFTVTDLTNGQVISTVDNHQFPDLVYREPESIFAWITGEGPRLAWGFATGATRRQMALYATPVHTGPGPVQIRATDADGQTTVVPGVSQIPCDDNPKPGAIVVHPAPCPQNRNRYSITYTNPNNRGVKVYWTVNDPQPTTHSTASGTVTSPRDYAPGTYRICVQDTGDATNQTCIDAVLPCGQITAALDCSPAAENPTGRKVVLTVTGAASTVDIAWGDTTTDTGIDPGRPIEHTYAADNTEGYSVLVTDANNPDGVTPSGSPIVIPCTAPTS